MERPIKQLSPQEWETLIEDFQSAADRCLAQFPGLSLLDLALHSLLRRDTPLPLKSSLILFLDENSLRLIPDPASSSAPALAGVLDALRSLVQSPVDAASLTLYLKEQMMVSSTSFMISLDALDRSPRHLQGLVELLLTVANRPNHSVDRHTRSVACECLRELENAYPCLLAEITPHLWNLCQSERTHASQSYILLLTAAIHNLILRSPAAAPNISLLSTSFPLVPFNIPHSLIEGAAQNLNSSNPNAVWDDGIHVDAVGDCGGARSPGLAPEDALDGEESDLARRLTLMSKEVQQPLAFRLLPLHWLLGFKPIKIQSLVPMASEFYPNVFDPLALKALKLDVLAYCSICIDTSLKIEGIVGEDVGTGTAVVKLFEEGLICVSAFKWLPPWSLETAVAFRTLHKFLIGVRPHSGVDDSSLRVSMESIIFRTIQTKLVNLAWEFRSLVPVIVAFVNRLLGCSSHCCFGERLLQTFDEHLLSKLSIDYKLASYFPIFDRIAEDETVPPCGLLELLTAYIVFLVEKHGPETGLRSWSQGSKVLGICRTMLMHHHSSRVFQPLSQLLAFTCQSFPDVEVRDNARIYLRMLLCIPGVKLRHIMNLGEQLPGVSPSPHLGAFFQAQSPRPSHDAKNLQAVSSYIHLERVIPLLVKQSWSLAISGLGIENNKHGYFEVIGDSKPHIEKEGEGDGGSDVQLPSAAERIEMPQEPLRVMDSKVAEILGILRVHFASIPDFRHMPGFKIKIPCTLRFESEPFSRIWGVDTSGTSSDGVDSLPALYAIVITFSSSAPYGSIPPFHIPFLLGESSRKYHDLSVKGSLDIVPIENGSDEIEEESFRATVIIELEPRKPMPGLVDVSIEANAENGQIIRGPLQSITVGIEDIFLTAVVPSDIMEDAIPEYYSDLFHALWEACGNSSSTGRETFLLKGGKGIAAISGISSVKLLEVPAYDLIGAVERYLAPFIVSVTGQSLVNTVKDGGVIKDVIWKYDTYDDATLVPPAHSSPLQLKYIHNGKDPDSPSSVGKRNMGGFHVLIFLPPRFHLLLQMEVSEISTLVRIRTDHWPCLAYIDDYLESLFLT
ncbi:hypothetical protein MRB53_034082 [Persea americana]|uniref:Uncharacterized protein n=1 Tax=Persea americana TaxID=3435 RepID=A0ACC2KWU7_PERAE|nr:hypothetical protein MRB53_034082 [Persea americana]